MAHAQESGCCDHGHDHKHEHESDRAHDCGGGHSHEGGHGHGHAHSLRSMQRHRLLLCVIITGAVMIVEAIGGVLSGSLALLSDSGHMLTDFFSLVLAFSAIALASRPATDTRSFGFYRAEILAAFVNGLLLVGATLYILYEAVVRLVRPTEVHHTGMLIVALVGLAANLAGAMLLMGAGHGNLNVRGAFLHMVGDTLSSVGVVAGALIIRFTGWERIDPILSAAIALMIGFSAWRLLRDSANVLLESRPKHLRATDIPAAICAAHAEVREVHDLHVWEITSSMYAMTVHIALDPGTTMAQTEELRVRLERFVSEKYRIGHAIFQFETVGAAEGHHAGPATFDERGADDGHGHHH
ncbi:MAG TPA: cation diffusion facilitator family transporter [Planctomycetota bacterium]|nr:cation diffusion facilitator family transporter [Planctomycetota bacterium]